MIPTIHLIVSLILTAILYPFFGPLSSLVLITGFLVDFDHVIYYVLKFRNFNLKEAYYFYKKKKMETKVINIFHTIEVWILCIILSIYNIYFMIGTIGLFVHVFMDYIHLITAKRLSVRYNTITAWVHSLITKKQQSL